MILTDFSDHICDKMFKTDSSSVAACKRFVRRRYEMLYNKYLWKDTLLLSSVAANSNILVMPKEIGLIVGARWGDSTPLDPVEFSFLLRNDPGAFERTGSPAKVTTITAIGIKQAISTAERLSFVSDSTSDTSITVLIRGELAGVEQVEQVALNGTTTVNSTKSWDVVWTLSKPATTGTITVTGLTSSTNYLTLWDEDRELKYQRLRLFDSPTDTTKNLLVLGKRRFRGLTKDQDTSIIPALDDVLLAYGEADMLQRARQYGKANEKIQEATALLFDTLSVSIYQQASVVQLTPENVGEYNRLDFE